MLFKNKKKFINLSFGSTKDRVFEIGFVRNKLIIIEFEDLAAVAAKQFVIKVCSQEQLYCCFAPLAARLWEYHIHAYLQHKLQQKEEVQQLHNFTYACLQHNTGRLLLGYAERFPYLQLSKLKFRVDMQYLAILRFIVFSGCIAVLENVSLVICVTDNSIYLAAYGSGVWGYEKTVSINTQQNYLDVLSKLLFGCPIKLQNITAQVYLLGSANDDICNSIANSLSCYVCIVNPIARLNAVYPDNLSGINLITLLGSFLWDSI